MDVVRNNFLGLLPQIYADIDEADFVAIDTEFSGLGQNRHHNLFDTLDDRYHKVKESCKEYCVLQVGLACFLKTTEADKFGFNCKCYNFFVFPYKVQNTPKLPDKSYIFQPSAFHFLAGHNFDFNKWIREGISYMTLEEEAILMQAINKNKGESESDNGETKNTMNITDKISKASTFVPDEHKEFMDKFFVDLTKFIDNSLVEKLDLEPCSSYRRKLIYESVKNMQLSGVKLSSCMVSEGSPDRFISIVKISPEQKQKDENDLINEAVGFSKVIQHLVQTKKPIIGHNLLIDIVHIIRHFITPLPDELSEFKTMLSELFPHIFDTKVVACDDNLKELITNTVLNDLYRTLQKEPFKNVDVTIANKAENDESNVSYHQAGYDAFITGSCFINMVHHLHPKAKNIPFNALAKHQGKLHLTYSFDFPFLDISKPQLTSSRNNVYHLTFPCEWTRDNLNQLFSPFGPIQIGWINDTSAFVAIKDERRANDVEKNIKNSSTSLFTVQSYQKYIKQKMIDSLSSSSSASTKPKRSVNEDANKEIEEGEIITKSPPTTRRSKRAKIQNRAIKNEQQAY